MKFQIKTVFSFKFVTESSRHRRLSVTVAAYSLVMLIFAPPFLSGRSLPVAEPATESRSVLALGKTGSPSHFPSVWPWMIHTVLLVCLGWQQSFCREESAVCQVKWEWVSVCWKRSSQHWFCSLSYCTSLVGRTKKSVSFNSNDMFIPPVNIPRAPFNLCYVIRHEYAIG